jgi:very-short-patch-repair endonuclease
MTYSVDTIECIKINLISFFKENGITRDDDFTEVEDEDNNKITHTCISKDKANLLLGKNDVDDVISLSELYDKVALLCNDYTKMEILSLFCIVDIHKKKSFCEIVDTTIDIRQQTKFTYSLNTFMSNHFPEISFRIENNFLSKTRFKELDIGRIRKFRVDIIFDSLTLVIEFDEKHHLLHEHFENDKERNQIISTLGYEVIHVKYDYDSNIFFKNLNEIIKKQQFLNTPEKLTDYIINTFTNQGHDKDRIELLVSEFCDDIVNGVIEKDIGMTPNKISFNGLLEYLQILKDGDPDTIDDLKEIIEISELPYDETDEDIILCPKLLDMLLLQISSKDYPQVIDYYKLFSDIKQTFLLETYKNNTKLNQLRIDNRLAIENVMTIMYKHAKKDYYIENKKSEITIYNITKKFDIFYEYFLTTLRNGNINIKRLPLIKIPTTLKINRPIIPEIPEIIYTGDPENDIIIDDLKIYITANSKRYKFKPNNVEHYVNIIRDKLKCKGNCTNKLFHCILLPLLI